MGYDQEVIQAVVALYERVTSRVQVGTSWTTEIMNTRGVKLGCYTYMGVVFSRPIFTMHLSMQAPIRRGYATLTRLEQ